MVYWMCLLHVLTLPASFIGNNHGKSVDLRTEASRQFFPIILQSWAQISKRKGIGINI